MPLNAKMLEHKPDQRTDDTRGEASGKKLIRNWGLTLLLFAVSQNYKTCWNFLLDFKTYYFAGYHSVVKNHYFNSYLLDFKTFRRVGRQVKKMYYILSIMLYLMP